MTRTQHLTSSIVHIPFVRYQYSLLINSCLSLLYLSLILHSIQQIKTTSKIHRYLPSILQHSHPQIGFSVATAVFCIIGMLTFRNGPFIRPHPAIWRVVLSLSIIYEIVMVVVLFQVFQLQKHRLCSLLLFEFMSTFITNFRTNTTSENFYTKQIHRPVAN